MRERKKPPPAARPGHRLTILDRGLALWLCLSASPPHRHTRTRTHTQKGKTGRSSQAETQTQGNEMENVETPTSTAEDRYSRLEARSHCDSAHNVLMASRGPEREMREEGGWERMYSGRCDIQLNVHLKDGTHVDESPCL